MTHKITSYPLLKFTAQEISAFAYVPDNIFILSLKNGKTDRFIAADENHFRQWLSSHNIREVNAKK